MVWQYRTHRTTWQILASGGAGEGRNSAPAGGQSAHSAWIATESQRELSFLHEFGHLQTLPPANLATFLLLKRAKQTGRLKWSQGVWLWAEHHALWEMMAEGYVM